MVHGAEDFKLSCGHANVLRAKKGVYKKSDSSVHQVSRLFNIQHEGYVILTIFQNTSEDLY